VYEYAPLPKNDRPCAKTVSTCEQTGKCERNFVDPLASAEMSVRGTLLLHIYDFFVLWGKVPTKRKKKNTSAISLILWRLQICQCVCLFCHICTFFFVVWGIAPA